MTSQLPTTAESIKQVTVYGFGTMGCGIAQVIATAGIPVKVVEESSETLQRNTAAVRNNLARLHKKGQISDDQLDNTLPLIDTSPSSDDAHASDLFIEAIPERLDLKLALFETLSAAAKPNAILATNTSAISVTAIAGGAARPERVCGLHFFNPVPVLPLVEVVRAERTSSEVVELAQSFVRKIGKTPIVCGDTPGFVVNRILIPMLNDVVGLWDAGLASAEDIDTGCRLGLNWPIGPLALADLIGLDVALHAAEALYDAYREPRMAPPPALTRLVTAGKLGRKSGEGFYQYQA